MLHFRLARPPRASVYMQAGGPAGDIKAAVFPK